MSSRPIKDKPDCEQCKVKMMRGADGDKQIWICYECGNTEPRGKQDDNK